MLAAGDRVVVAASGGSDSTALGRILVALAPRHQWQVAGFVHVHHGLRGAEADRDEAFCRAEAERLGRPIHVVHVDAARQARVESRSVESAARDLRYAAFAEACQLFNATRLATGHTLDDQAETVLLRAMRGAGAKGLSGVRLRRGAIVRPLLESRRSALRHFLDSGGVSYLEDTTNDDRAIPRNRVRHDLLPHLRRFAPRVDEALARTAALAAADEEVLGRLAIEAAASLVLSRRGNLADTSSVQMEIDASGLAALPRAIGSRVVRRALDEWGTRGVGATHVDDVLALAGRSGGVVHLPGIEAERRGRTLTLRRAARGVAKVASFEYRLRVPGDVALPESELVVRAGVASDESGVTAQPAVVAIDAERARGGLVVRSRRPGDRFRPAGSPGSRKVQDLMVDRKIARDTRDRVPIVTLLDGSIVWVVGVAVAEGYLGSAVQAGMVILQVVPLVGDR